MPRDVLFLNEENEQRKEERGETMTNGFFASGHEPLLDKQSITCPKINHILDSDLKKIIKENVFFLSFLVLYERCLTANWPSMP